MPFVYRCRQCRAASRPGSRRAAEDARQEHRDIEHGGLVPEGERIEYVPGSTRDPDARYVSTGGLLGLLILLAVASMAARLLGH
jgi:hypothetical protein